MDIFQRLSELSKQKGINAGDLILSGMSPEEALAYLEKYQPPVGLGGTIMSPIRGFIGGTAGGIADVARLVGIPEVAEPFEKVAEYMAIPPDSNLLAHVGYTLGNVASLGLGPGVLRILGAAPKVVKFAGQVGVPALLGLSTAQRAYEEQPEGEDDPYRALLGGAIAGGAAAIPLHRAMSKIMKSEVSPETARRIAEGAEKLQSYPRMIAKEAGIGALTFPAVTALMEAGHQLGARGEIAPAEIIEHRLSKPGIAEAIVGALLGGAIGARSRYLLGKEVERQKPIVELIRAQKEEERYYPEDLLPEKEGEQVILYDRYLVSKSTDREGVSIYTVVDTLENDINEFYYPRQVFEFIESREPKRPERPVSRQEVSKTVEDLPPSEQEIIINKRFSIIKTVTPDGKVEYVVNDLKRPENSTIITGQFGGRVEDALRYVDSILIQEGAPLSDLLNVEIKPIGEERFKGYQFDLFPDLEAIPSPRQPFIYRPPLPYRDFRYYPTPEQLTLFPKQAEIKETPSTRESIPFEKLPKTSQTIINKINSFLNYVNDKGEVLLGVEAFREGKKIKYQLKLRQPDGTETYRDIPSITKAFSEIKKEFKKPETESRSDTISKEEGVVPFIPDNLSTADKAAIVNKELTNRGFYPHEDLAFVTSTLTGKYNYKFLDDKGNPISISGEGLNIIPRNITAIKEKFLDAEGNQLLGFGEGKDANKQRLFLFYRTKEGELKSIPINSAKDLEILDKFTKRPTAESRSDTTSTGEKPPSSKELDADFAEFKKIVPEAEPISVDDAIKALSPESEFAKNFKDATGRKITLSAEDLDILKSAKEAIENRYQNEDGAQLVGLAKNGKGMWAVIKYPEEIFGKLPEGNVQGVLLDRDGIALLKEFTKPPEKKAPSSDVAVDTEQESAGKPPMMAAPIEGKETKLPHPRQAEIEKLKQSINKEIEKIKANTKLKKEEKEKKIREVRSQLDKYSLVTVPTNRVGFFNEKGQLLLGISKPKGLDEVYALIKEPTGEYTYRVLTGKEQDAVSSLNSEFSKFNIDYIERLIDTANSEAKNLSLYKTFGGSNVIRATLNKVIDRMKDSYKQIVDLELLSFYSTLDTFSKLKMGDFFSFVVEGEHAGAINKSLFERADLKIVDAIMNNFMKEGRIPKELPPSVVEAVSLVTQLLYKNPNSFRKLPYEKVSQLYKTFIDLKNFESIASKEIVAPETQESPAEMKLGGAIVDLFSKTYKRLEGYLSEYSQSFTVKSNKEAIKKAKSVLNNTQDRIDNLTKRRNQLDELRKAIEIVKEAKAFHDERLSAYAMESLRQKLASLYIEDANGNVVPRYTPKEIERIIESEKDKAKAEYDAILARLDKLNPDFNLLKEFGKTFVKVEKEGKIITKETPSYYKSVRSINGLMKLSSTNPSLLDNIYNDISKEIDSIDNTLQGLSSAYVAYKNLLENADKISATISLIKDGFVKTLQELITVGKTPEEANFSDILKELTPEHITEIERIVDRLKSLQHVNEKGKKVALFDGKQLDSILTVIKTIASKENEKEGSSKPLQEALRKIASMPSTIFNVDTYERFVKTVYNYISKEIEAKILGKDIDKYALLNKEYIITDTAGKKYVDVDKVFSDIRKATDVVTRKLFGQVGEEYLDAPFMTFVKDGREVTKTLRDLVVDNKGNYNPIAVNILLSVRNYIERVIPENSESRYAFYEHLYEKIKNPVYNILPQVLFIPDNFTKLREFAKTGKLIKDKQSMLEGKIIITLPEMTKLNAFEAKYIDAFLKLEGTELDSEIKHADKIFTLGTVGAQTHIRMLVLDAKTMVEKGFKERHIPAALRVWDKTHIADIQRQFITALFGHDKIGRLTEFHDALQLRRLTEEHWKAYKKEVPRNLIDYYATAIIADFINTERLIRRLADLYPTERELNYLRELIKDASKDLSSAQSYEERMKIREAKEKLSQLSEPVGSKHEPLLKAVQKAREESVKKETKSRVQKFLDLIDEEAQSKQEVPEEKTQEPKYNKDRVKKFLDLLGERAIDEAQIDPRILKDPINFINFIQRAIARVLGENVDIVINPDHLATILEYKYGNKIVGFALKFADRNYIGILMDGERLTVNDAITIGHELAHFVWDRLSVTDQQLILNRYKNIENFADAFGRYLFGKYEPPSFAKRAFEMMKDLWERIRNLFRGMGFTSSRDIFDKIEAGEYATKNPNEVPTVRIVDAWELSRRLNPEHKEHDWEIAFRKKVAEAESLKDRIMSKASEAINYAKWIIKGVGEEPGILRYLYQRGKDYLMLPVFHEHLKGILEKYKIAQSYVAEVIMPKYEEVYNMLNLLKEKNLIEPLKTLVIASDAEGKYFVDARDRLISLYPHLKEHEINAVLRTYDAIKEFTDRVYITIHKQGFLKLASIMKGQASFEASRGYITEQQKNAIILAVDKLITQLNNDFYKFYEYTIIDGERRPIGGQRKNYEKYIREFVDTLVAITGDAGIQSIYKEATDGKSTIGAYIKGLEAMGEELKQLADNPLSDFVILAAIIARNTHLGYDLFREVLDNGYYFPRVRGEGNHELRVYFKIPVKDEAGNIIPNKFRYIEIEYLDTNRDKSDRVQLAERQQMLDELKRIYKDAPVMDTIEAYAKDLPISTALENFVKREFKLSDITEEAPDYVIVVGRKAPKEKEILYQHTMSELILFLGHLATRAGSEKLSKEIRDKLPQILGQMYADINYAMARKLHRVRLPKEALVSAVQGYRQDVIEVLNEYAIRMQGHLSNNMFLTDIMDMSYNPEFREFSIRNPHAKELIDKQINLYLSPNTRLANAVYKMRAITAMMYLGFRISSALLNGVNFPMIFLPEYNDLKASGFNLYLNKSLRGIETVLGGVKDTGLGDINRIDVLKKYPEAWKDLIEAMKTVERYASWKFEYENILGEKVKAPVIDRLTMKINIEPVRQKLLEAQARGDKAEIEKLQRDLFILEGLNKLVAEQTIESSMYHTLRMEGMHLFGKTMNKLFEASFFPFRMTERYVRTVSAVMTLNEIYNQLSRGKSFEQVYKSLNDAVRVTSQIIDQTYFRYDRLNRYWWTNPSKSIGAILSMPTTLRGFAANFLSALFSWAERKQWDKIATSMATLFVLGGVAALPAVDDLINQMEKITGSPLRLKLYKAAKDLFGDEDIARILIKGVPSLVIDFSTSTKVEFPLLPKSWDFNGFAEVFFGVHKDLMDRWLTKAPQAWNAGDYFGALTYLAPLGIGLPIQAIGLTTEGLKTKYGRTISDIETGQPFKLSAEEAVLRGLGFRPIRLAEIQDMRYFGTKIAKKYDEWRTRIYNQLRRATDNEDLIRVFKEIDEFNRAVMEYGGAIAPITREGIRRAQAPRKDEALLISRNLLAR